jgi:hypothetical protein
MKAKSLDVYFVQDTWLEDAESDIDVEDYHVYGHNGPNRNHLHHGVAKVLLPRYFAGWKAVGIRCSTMSFTTLRLCQIVLK